MHGHALCLQQLVQSSLGWSHQYGVMALLKFWNDSFSDEPATPIIKHTRRGSIRSSLLRGRSLPPWMIDGERFGEHGSDLEDDRIRVRILALRHALSILSTPQQSVEDVNRIDTEAQELDEALRKWAAKSLNTYTLHTLAASITFPTKHFYTPTVYSYNDLGNAARCAQYFATRMILISTRVKVRLKARESTEEAGFRCASTRSYAARMY